MASEVNDVMTATAETETQIVGAFPQIIVTGTVEKPFYQIMYCENEDGEIHLGYGSFDLSYVFKWLEEFFGVTHASAVNPESLRPKGRWVETVYSVHDGYTDEYFEEINYDCVVCDYCSDWKSPYCPNCGADMRGDSE